MLNKIKNWFSNTDLNSAVNDVKKVKINGVLFHVKKINPLDHLEGSKVMMKVYDTYEGNRDSKAIEMATSKVRTYYRDIIMAGVVKPALSRKEDSGTGVFVDDIFKDWDMSEKLVEFIITHTYGKKKIMSAHYQGAT
jgi:hypothetical protein